MMKIKVIKIIIIESTKKGHTLIQSNITNYKFNEKVVINLKNNEL